MPGALYWNAHSVVLKRSVAKISDHQYIIIWPAAMPAVKAEYMVGIVLVEYSGMLAK